MVSVVTEKCIKCKYMECVEVCPVDAFYEGANMVVINPDECISCGVCRVECPIEAITTDDEADEKMIELNAKYSEEWPNVTAKGQVPADADDYKEEVDKLEKYFDPAPGAGDA